MMKLSDYTEKSIVVTLSYDIFLKLTLMGGIYNDHLKNGLYGWIFQKSRQMSLRKQIDLLSQEGGINLIILEYSEKALLVKIDDPKISSQLALLVMTRGKYNSKLISRDGNCFAGWIYPATSKGKILNAFSEWILDCTTTSQNYTPTPIYNPPTPIHNPPTPTPIYNPPTPNLIDNPPTPIHTPPTPNPIHNPPTPNLIDNPPTPIPMQKDDLKTLSEDFARVIDYLEFNNPNIEDFKFKNYWYYKFSTKGDDIRMLCGSVMERISRYIKEGHILYVSFIPTPIVNTIVTKDVFLKTAKFYRVSKPQIFSSEQSQNVISCDFYKDSLQEKNYILPFVLGKGDHPCKGYEYLDILKKIYWIDPSPVSNNIPSTASNSIPLSMMEKCLGMNCDYNKEIQQNMYI